MGNIIGETECISSRYSNEFELRWKREENDKKRKLDAIRRDALDQEQKWNKKLIRCGSKKKKYSK